jgi:hypothetical protein
LSYIDEVGGHAGPSPEELHTFVVAPPDARLPARIDHPVQLDEVFIPYPSLGLGAGPEAPSDTLSRRRQAHALPRA